MVGFLMKSKVFFADFDRDRALVVHRQVKKEGTQLTDRCGNRCAGDTKPRENSDAENQERV